jgi:uncharacterized protein (TIRG00374 family)
MKKDEMNPARTWLRRALSLAAYGLLITLFWPLIGELSAAVGLLRQASWAWLAAAVCLQLVSYACLAMLNYTLLRPFKGQAGFFYLMATLPAIAFIETALPSAGASGVLLRARLLGRRGYNLEASTFTLGLESLYLGLVMGLASLAGLWFLVDARQLSAAQLAALLGLAGLALAALAAAWYCGRHQLTARRALRWLAAAWNRLARRWRLRPLDDAALDSRLADFYLGLQGLGQTPPWQLLAAALGRVILDVSTLAVCFWGFDYAISAGALLTGYGLMLLLSGLASLPGGLGLADASLAVIYARLGTPGAVAIVAALAYRLIAFWLLRLIGFITWQVLEARQ